MPTSLRVSAEEPNGGPLFHQFDFLHMDRQLLAALVDRIDEKDLLSIASEIGLPHLKDIIHSLYGAATLDAFRRFLELFAKYEYSWPVPYRRFENGKDEERFVFRHGICRKWSILTGEIGKLYLKELGLQARYEVTTNTTILTILSKKVNELPT